MKEFAYISCRYDKETCSWFFTDAIKSEMPEDKYNEFFSDDYIKRVSLKVDHIDLLFPTMVIAHIFQRGLHICIDFIRHPDRIKDSIVDHLISENVKSQ